MTPDKKQARLREPVQVYLTSADRKLLREAAAAAGVSGAEVLRRGLRRMAGEILGTTGPALRMLEEMNAADWRDAPDDAASAHDRYLTEPAAPPPRSSK